MALLSPTLSATKALAERLFAAIDTNANGRLSRVELRAFLLASADESGDPARALLAAELGTAFAFCLRQMMHDINLRTNRVSTPDNNQVAFLHKPRIGSALGTCPCLPACISQGDAKR